LLLLLLLKDSTWQDFRFSNRPVGVKHFQAIAGDRIQTEAIEFRGGDFSALPWHHECHYFLSPLFVWKSQHRYFKHARVLKQHFLDLAGIDIASARNDHIFGPVFEREESIRSNHTDVTGVEGMAQ